MCCDSEMQGEIIDNMVKCMARFSGKKSLEKSNRNKANRFKKSIENFNRFVLPFNLPIIT